MIFPGEADPTDRTTQHLGQQSRQLVFLALHDALQVEAAGHQNDGKQGKNQTAECKRQATVHIGKGGGIIQTSGGYWALHRVACGRPSQSGVFVGQCFLKEAGMGPSHPG